MSTSDKKDSFEAVIATLEKMMALRVDKEGEKSLLDAKRELLAEGKDLREFVPYLLLLWASFGVRQLEPETDGGSAIGTIIPLDNGRQIVDFGTSLYTSPGEAETSYCSGKLLESVKEMVDLLASRGATRVSISGHDLAKRAAWIQCLDSNIEVSGYEPTEVDQKTRARILKVLTERQKRVQQSLSKPFRPT